MSQDHSYDDMPDLEPIALHDDMPDIESVTLYKDKLARIIVQNECRNLVRGLLKPTPKAEAVYIPETMRTPKSRFAAVARDGRALRYVPMELRTLKLCTVAVKQCECALEYVPAELRTEVCAIIARQSH